MKPEGETDSPLRRGDGSPEGRSSSTFGGAERLMPTVTLRSVQAYRTQDEYVVAMKEDLADWFNELYSTSMSDEDLFEHLETGVLLCRHACVVNDIIAAERDAAFSSSSSSAAPEPVVFRERGVEPGSFQARVNVAAFLSWCRRSPFCLPDTLLFETGDLICAPPAERNERQVALSLLEVGRRGAALGLPAPLLVRLEAEIDAEIRRGDVDNDGDIASASTDNTASANGDTDAQLADVYPTSMICLSSKQLDPSDSQNPDSVAQSTTSKLPGQRLGGGGLKMPSVFARRGGSDQPSSRTEQEQQPEDNEDQDCSTSSERRVYTWQRHRYRPIIPVDMMSLDEMVREILGRCTCPNQYPMIRVSEGKYRVGDNLTLIFVRILRRHVMVRIGGGWNTLDNYLARCDPCRCHKNGADSAVASAVKPPTSGDVIDERRQQQQQQQRVRELGRRRSNCDSLTSTPMTTVTRRPSDLGVGLSRALPLGTTASTGARSRYVETSERQAADPRKLRQPYDVASEERSEISDISRVLPAVTTGGTDRRDRQCEERAAEAVLESTLPCFNDVDDGDISGRLEENTVSEGWSTPGTDKCPRGSAISPPPVAAAAADERRGSADSRGSGGRASRIPVSLAVAQLRSRSATGLQRRAGGSTPPLSRASRDSDESGEPIRRCDSGVDMTLVSPDSVPPVSY